MDVQSFLAELDGLFELEPGTITPDDTIQDIPGWSSLTFMGLIALVDEELGLSLTPETILGCKTVGDLLQQVGFTSAGAHEKAA